MYEDLDVKIEPRSDDYFKMVFGSSGDTEHSVTSPCSSLRISLDQDLDNEISALTAELPDIDYDEQDSLSYISDDEDDRKGSPVHMPCYICPVCTLPWNTMEEMNMHMKQHNKNMYLSKKLHNAGRYVNDWNNKKREEEKQSKQARFSQGSFAGKSSKYRRQFSDSDSDSDIIFRGIKKGRFKRNREDSDEDYLPYKTTTKKKKQNKQKLKSATATKKAQLPNVVPVKKHHEINTASVVSSNKGNCSHEINTASGVSSNKGNYSILRKRKFDDDDSDHEISRKCSKLNQSGDYIMRLPWVVAPVTKWEKKNKRQVIARYKILRFSENKCYVRKSTEDGYRPTNYFGSSIKKSDDAFSYLAEDMLGRKASVSRTQDIENVICDNYDVNLRGLTPSDEDVYSGSDNDVMSPIVHHEMYETSTSRDTADHKKIFKLQKIFINGEQKGTGTYNAERSGIFPNTDMKKRKSVITHCDKILDDSYPYRKFIGGCNVTVDEYYIALLISNRGDGQQIQKFPEVLKSGIFKNKQYSVTKELARIEAGLSDLEKGDVTSRPRVGNVIIVKKLKFPGLTGDSIDVEKLNSTSEVNIKENSMISSSQVHTYHKKGRKTKSVTSCDNRRKVARRKLRALLKHQKNGLIHINGWSIAGPKFWKETLVEAGLCEREDIVSMNFVDSESRPGYIARICSLWYEALNKKNICASPSPDTPVGLRCSAVENSIADRYRMEQYPSSRTLVGPLFWKRTLLENDTKDLTVLFYETNSLTERDSLNAEGIMQNSIDYLETSDSLNTKGIIQNSTDYLETSVSTLYDKENYRTFVSKVSGDVTNSTAVGQVVSTKKEQSFLPATGSGELCSSDSLNKDFDDSRKSNSSMSSVSPVEERTAATNDAVNIYHDTNTIDLKLTNKNVVTKEIAIDGFDNTHKTMMLVDLNSEGIFPQQGTNVNSGTCVIAKDNLCSNDINMAKEDQVVLSDHKQDYSNTVLPPSTDSMEEFSNFLNLDCKTAVVESLVPDSVLKHHSGEFSENENTASVETPQDIGCVDFLLHSLDINEIIDPGSSVMNVELKSDDLPATSGDINTYNVDSTMAVENSVIPLCEQETNKWNIDTSLLSDIDFLNNTDKPVQCNLLIPENIQSTEIKRTNTEQLYASRDLEKKSLVLSDTNPHDSTSTLVDSASKVCVTEGSNFTDSNYKNSDTIPDVHDKNKENVVSLQKKSENYEANDDDDEKQCLNPVSVTCTYSLKDKKDNNIDLALQKQCTGFAPYDAALEQQNQDGINNCSERSSDVMDSNTASSVTLENMSGEDNGDDACSASIGTEVVEGKTNDVVLDANGDSCYGPVLSLVNRLQEKLTIHSSPLKSTELNAECVNNSALSVTSQEKIDLCDTKITIDDDRFTSPVTKDLESSNIEKFTPILDISLEGFEKNAGTEIASSHDISLEVSDKNSNARNYLSSPTKTIPECSLSPKVDDENKCMSDIDISGNAENIERSQYADVDLHTDAENSTSDVPATDVYRSNGVSSEKNDSDVITISDDEMEEDQKQSEDDGVAGDGSGNDTSSSVVIISDDESKQPSASEDDAFERECNISISSDSSSASGSSTDKNNVMSNENNPSAVSCDESGSDNDEDNIDDNDSDGSIWSIASSKDNGDNEADVNSNRDSSSVSSDVFSEPDDSVKDGSNNDRIGNRIETGSVVSIEDSNDVSQYSKTNSVTVLSDNEQSLLSAASEQVPDSDVSDVEKGEKGQKQLSLDSRNSPMSVDEMMENDASNTYSDENSNMANNVNESEGNSSPRSGNSDVGHGRVSSNASSTSQKSPKYSDNSDDEYYATKKERSRSVSTDQQGSSSNTQFTSTDSDSSSVTDSSEENNAGDLRPYEDISIEEADFVLSVCTTCGILVNLALDFPAFIPDGDFPCNECLRLLYNKKGINKHYDAVHSHTLPPYRCHLCNIDFAYWYFYQQHFKKHVQVTKYCKRCGI